jgi:hypothetical protein
MFDGKLSSLTGWLKLSPNSMRWTFGGKLFFLIGQSNIERDWGKIIVLVSTGNPVNFSLKFGWIDTV